MNDGKLETGLRARAGWACALTCLLLMATVAAAEPGGVPPHINYQGVLRSVDGAPLEGDFPMTFRFLDDPDPAAPENEILKDDYAAVGVAGGMFNVSLGSGSVFDGTGPGTYTSLIEVFRDFEPVFLEVTVNGETLLPRIHVLSAGYAMNSLHLAGHDMGFFLNMGDAHQIKEGRFTADATADTVGYGVEGYGPDGGGYFSDSNNVGYAYVGYANMGIFAGGSSQGGYFVDADGSGYAIVATGDRGIEAFGSGAGGFFTHTGGGGEAYLGQADAGIRASGTSFGARFDDLQDTGYAVLGYGDRGLEGHGSEMGGRFTAPGAATNTWAEVATVDGFYTYGLQAHGDYGIDVTGAIWGGRFNSAKVNGITETNVLRIVGGSDLAEPFPVRDPEAVAEGSVLVIDEARPGALALSARAYDSRVAGVVSGAGGIRPGITMVQGEAGASEKQVALSGRVYAQATAANGAIRPGDLLTTSSLPGHAMKASDPGLSQGAVLGKAMSALDEGEGLVLVLVNLQ